MAAALTPDERKLVAHAKKAVTRYNKLRKRKSGIDKLYPRAYKSVQWD